MIRVFKGIIISSLIIFLFFVLTIYFLTMVYQNKVVRIVETQLEEKLNASVSYTHTSFNFFSWEKFWQLTLKMDDFVVKGMDTKTNLVERADVFCIFSFTNLFSGGYTIRKLEVENAQINLAVDKDWKGNYDKLWNLHARKNTFSRFSVILRNIQYHYINNPNHEEYTFHIEKARGTVRRQNDDYFWQWEGDLSDCIFRVNQRKFFSQKELHIHSKLSYKSDTKKWQIHPTEVTIRQSDFTLEGEYTLNRQKTGELDLSVTGKEGDLKPLLVFFPEEYYEALVNFKAKGKIYFQGKIRGTWSKRKYPGVNIKFGCKDVRIQSPHHLRREIKTFNFTGEFSNGTAGNLRTSSLKIKDLSGELSDKKVKGNLYMRNLLDPYLTAQLEAGVDLRALYEFFPFEAFADLKGLLGIKFDFNGRLQDLKDEASAGKVNVSGNMEVIHTNFQLDDNFLKFEDFNAHVEFVNHEANITQLSGKIAHSDFVFEGIVRNFFAYLLIPGVDIRLEGDFVSKKLNLEQLVSMDNLEDKERFTTVEKHAYLFKLPANIALDLNCRIDSIRFRNFEAHYFQGDVSLENQVLRTDKAMATVAGGQLMLLGILNGQQENFVTFDGRILLQDVETGRLFYMFEDFSQRLLKSSQINGKLEADIRCALVLDRYLQVQLPGVMADVDARIIEGKMEEVALLKPVAQRLQDDVLTNFRFREMKNIIQVRNKTIFIPEMDIQMYPPGYRYVPAKQKKTGFSPILSLMGRATVDKELDYKLKVTLQSDKAAPEATHSMIQGKGGIHTYFLSLKGKTDMPGAIFTHKRQKENLLEAWNREKKAYMKLFNKSTLSREDFKTTERKHTEEPKENKLIAIKK